MKVSSVNIILPLFLPNSLSLRTSLNSTIVDLRLNENKIRSVHYSSLSRFGNLTYLNLTKNDISYVEDGAFSAQFNLQVSNDIMYIHTHLCKCIFMGPLINAHTYNGGSPYCICRDLDMLSLQYINFLYFYTTLYFRGKYFPFNPTIYI